MKEALEKLVKEYAAREIEKTAEVSNAYSEYTRMTEELSEIKTGLSKFEYMLTIIDEEYMVNLRHALIETGRPLSIELDENENG